MSLPRQVDKLQELVVFAPTISLSLKFDVAARLPPVADRREFFLYRRSVLPEVEQNWLPRP